MEILADSVPIVGDLLISPGFWGALLLAMLIAGPIGLIPGVGGTTTIALLLPFLILSVDHDWPHLRRGDDCAGTVGGHHSGGAAGLPRPVVHG